MKTFKVLVLFASILLCAGQLLAQDGASAAETASKLRLQLSDVKNHEAELNIRLEQLNFDLKPENIERYFASVGSTRPEELRESRRRQLQAEKDRIVSLLSELSTTRTRLESDIMAADAKAYQQSALGSASLRPPAERRGHFLTAARVVTGVTVGLIVIAGIGFLVVRKRRRAA
jgi:hypothetical protein